VSHRAEEIRRTLSIKRTQKLIVVGAFFLLLFIPFVCRASYSNRPETVIVNRKFHNREIKLRVGEQSVWI